MWFDFSNIFWIYFNATYLFHLLNILEIDKNLIMLNYHLINGNHDKYGYKK